MQNHSTLTGWQELFFLIQILQIFRRLLQSLLFRYTRSFDFETTRMISDQIALHSVQLPLLILFRSSLRKVYHMTNYCEGLLN